MIIDAPIVLISDLHLTADAPAGLAEFRQFSERLERVEQLFILGDLFEYWIGDDAVGLLGLDSVSETLKKICHSGVAVFLLGGNRDFLIGEALCKDTGCELLSEPAELELAGISTLLQHGDKLCIDDHEHQSFRTMVDSPQWRRDFLAREFSERQSLALAARFQSETSKRYKTSNIMDVNQKAVEQALRNSHSPLLIHGHTHRPGIHEVLLVDRSAWRVVLGDWSAGPSYVSIEKNLVCLHFADQIRTLSRQADRWELQPH